MKQGKVTVAISALICLTGSFAFSQQNQFTQNLFNFFGGDVFKTMLPETKKQSESLD